jgi:hypothetical protein
MAKVETVAEFFSASVDTGIPDDQDTADRLKAYGKNRLKQNKVR